MHSLLLHYNAVYKAMQTILLHSELCHQLMHNVFKFLAKVHDGAGSV